MAWSRQCCREHATTVHGASNFAQLNRCSKKSKLSGKSPQVAPESGGAAPSGDEVVSFTRRIMGGDGQPAADASEMSEARACCFICLGEEGRMLVNVCACRWSRAHESCLAKMVESGGTTCGVCKQEISHDKKALLTLTQQLCQTYPWAVLVHQLFSLAIALIALAIIMWSFLFLKEYGLEW